MVVLAKLRPGYHLVPIDGPVRLPSGYHLLPVGGLCAGYLRVTIQVLGRASFGDPEKRRAARKRLLLSMIG